MHDIDSILERLVDTVLDKNGEIIQDYETVIQEMQGRHEIIETEHHALLKHITDTIQNIQYEDMTQSSRASRRSAGQSSRSSSKSANTIMEAAALKTKLKYIEEEAQ